MVIIFVLVVLGIYLWILYKRAIYALPCIAGYYAANFASDTGAGFWGSGIVFLFVAFIVYTTGQQLFSRISWPPMRLALSAAYCIPAGIVAFFAVHGLSDLSGNQGPSGWWERVC